VECGPEFIESEDDYPTLLGQPGWTIVDREDVTLNYAASCRHQLEADKECKEELEILIGASEFAEHQADWRSKVAAIDDGLLRCKLFVAVPISFEKRQLRPSQLAASRISALESPFGRGSAL
jgi:hypothetical protein